MELVENTQLSETVDCLLRTLEVKEESVLRMRFGIGAQESMTLEEVGAQLGVTRERIRQIEAKALLRLRHPAHLDRFSRDLGATPPHWPEHPDSSEPTALDRLLDHIRAIGVTVEDSPDGSDRRVWVYITETLDSRSRKIVRKLIELGFEFWPGEGYWR